MKIEIKYHGNILNLPSKVAELSYNASREDLCVIINLQLYKEYFDSFEDIIEDFSEKIGIGIDRIKKSLKFWSDNGILSLEGENSFVDIKSKDTTTYSGQSIKSFIDNNENIKSLFITCQDILGKVFNTHDHNNIIFLKNYLKLTDDYIMLLLSYCKEIDKTSWAYIKKLAIDLYEDGIDTYKRLEDHLADRKNKKSPEYKIRKLFDIGARELTKNEKEKIGKLIEYNLSIDYIRLAYELTIEKVGKFSLNYCCKVIDNWLSCGLKTPKDVEEYLSKSNNKTSNSSFETDDFFKAALERSYKGKE